MTQGNAPEAEGSSRSDTLPNSQKEQGSATSVTDALSRAMRPDLPKTHPASAEKGGSSSIEQGSTGQNSDSTLHTERSHPTNTSLGQPQEARPNVQQANDGGKSRDALSTDQGARMASADAASRGVRPDLPGNKSDQIQAATKVTFTDSDIAAHSKAHVIEGRPTLLSKEQDKGLRIDSPKDGVGFQRGSSQLVPGTLEQWFANLSEGQRKALSDPHASVIITATASRLGSESDNLQLSAERANTVQKWLQDHGIRASIETQPLGEEPAKQAGKADGTDDPSDRVAKIEIIPAEQRPAQDGVKSIMDQLTPPPKEDRLHQQFQDHVKIVGEGIKEALKGDPEGAVLKVGAKELVWAGKQLLRDLRENEIRMQISSNLVPAFMGRMADLTGVQRLPHHHPLQDKSTYARLGKEMAERMWNDLSGKERQHLTTLAQSNQGRAFQRELEDAVRNLYLSRGIKY